MHYKNGREAHNGDKVLLIPSYGAPVVGILYDAVAGNDFCNGKIAPTSPSDPCPNLKEVLHFDDVLAAIDADELNHVAIAKIAHEANRAWCAVNGDNSQPAWEDAPEWQRQSALNGVRFHRKNPDAGDSASHDSWMAEKVAAGWVYGPEKHSDATPPTHPCIVPFAQLPPEQQFKDRLFRTIVHAAS